MDIKDMDRVKELQLTHMLEEWKYLNGYINNIDVGYQSSMVFLLAVFTGLVGFFSKSENELVRYCILFIPLGIEVVLAYVDYQFRIVAILRGHLEGLEREMNKILQKNIHSWNSALVEMYMAKNNIVNKVMMLPICILFLAIAVLCFFILKDIMWNSLINKYVFGIYWTIIFMFSVVILSSFINNEKVRHKTSNGDFV